jgi:hypothetical protein
MPVAFDPVLSPTTIPYVPAIAVVGTRNEPDTWPVLALRAQEGSLPAAMNGTTVAVQLVAVDSNPDPVYVNTLFIDPEVGTTTMLAVTLNTANPP